MEKRLSKLIPLPFTQPMAGFRATGVRQADYAIEPFLVFGEFYMDRPVFGPHPHAGISVMTYVMPDSSGALRNRDSLGDDSLIKPGGVHVTQAGRGIVHDEFPDVKGVECHAVQIWLNHAQMNRLIEPKAFSLPSTEVPEWHTESSRVRIIQGHYQTLYSPLDLVTRTVLLDVYLEPNTRLELEAEAMAFIYSVSGKINVVDEEIPSQSVAIFEPQGNQVVVKTGRQAANFIVASATPHDEPIVNGGPFVMTTRQQLEETHERLRRGEMGRLNPVVA